MFSLARDLCSSFSLKQFSLNCSCKSDRKDDSIHAVFLFMNAFFRTEHQKLSVSPAPAPLPVTGKGPDKGAPEHWLGHKGTVLPHAGSPEDRTFANAFLPPHSLSWTLCKAFFFAKKIPLYRKRFQYSGQQIVKLCKQILHKQILLRSSPDQSDLRPFS